MAASVFSVAAGCQASMHMISQGASEINISFVIEERDVPEVVKALHAHFFPVRAEGKSNDRAASLIPQAQQSGAQPTEVQ
jgi:hypothetical protein